MLPLAAEPTATTRPPDPAPLLEELARFRLENAALRLEHGALQDRIRELEARLGQTSANSSRPPSSDPPQAPARPSSYGFAEDPHQVQVSGSRYYGYLTYAGGY